MAENKLARVRQHPRGTMTIKRAYTPPRLEEYGTLRDLTRAELGTDSDYYGGSQDTFFAPRR